MARDRRRAQQRRDPRDEASLPARDDGAEAPDPLEHASGEVAEFEAALMSGGEAASEYAAVEPAADELQEDRDLVGRRSARAVPADSGGVAIGRGTRRAAPARGETREGSRVMAFLRACWAELQRVQWPDRRHVVQATGVVLGFCLIAGLYLGVLDVAFNKLVNAII